MMHLPKKRAAPDGWQRDWGRRRNRQATGSPQSWLLPWVRERGAHRSRSVAAVHTPDHDLVAASLADGHVATAASISPVLAVAISPVVVIPIIIATFTVGPLAVGSDTEVQLSERDRRFRGDSITSVFGGCRNTPHYARDGGDKRQFSHSNLLLCR